MKVGADKDWTLDLYAATAPSGEAGLHLRFTRAGEKFVVFLGRAEQAELARLLHWQKGARGEGSGVRGQEGQSQDRREATPPLPPTPHTLPPARNEP